jgi:hypothetical protein
MRMITKFLLLALVTVWLVGCASTITNLSPSQLPRNANGQYPVAVAFDTRQATIRPQTLTPYVIVGETAYPMQPTPLITNRWEAVIPVPASERFAHYHFKLDYEYTRMGKPGKNSMLSQDYTLRILDQ